MRKHPKQAFGIFHDGLVVRMVHLIHESGEVYLQAVDHTDLDKYWYKILDDPSVAPVDARTNEERTPAKGEIEIDEFDTDYVTNYQLQPSERMLGAFDLAHGVIALNVYEDNILKNNIDVTEKKELEKFIKTKVPLKQLKAGEYQSSIVHIGEHKQQWVHSGTNRLYDLLRDFGRTNHLHLFYQLADANDIALTDYFRVCYADEIANNTLLVYLGQEYRKAFVFHDGIWKDSLKLQISQALPDEETISSKLSLALDNAQLAEPERIVLCGDLASYDLVEYLKGQFSGATVELLSFGNVVLSSVSGDGHDLGSLSKYAIPIALAYKALHQDDPRFSPSNFLPSKVIEGQKEFKVAWHGVLVLFLLFGTVFGGTNLYMKSRLAYTQEKYIQRDLEATLNQKRVEAEEIQRVKKELEAQEANISAMGSILEGKNYWTHLLHTINSSFSRNPVSWLTNLKMEKGGISISGITTKRANVIAFANDLPNSQIKKVASTKIRDNTIWVFDILFVPPQVEWMKEIEEELRLLLEKDSAFADDDKSASTTIKIRTKPTLNIAKTTTTISGGKIHLPPIDPTYTPEATERMIKDNEAAAQDYYAFVEAINKGNMWDYRDLAQKFLKKYADTPFGPLVRWWLSYRLYLDREYSLAAQFVEPLLKDADAYYSHALLLKARLDLANGNQRYKEWYNALKSDYGRSPLMKQVAIDLNAIEGAGK